MPDNLSSIQHIVCVMMENRSFDNVLGWLYPASQTNFNGLAQVTPTPSNPYQNETYPATAGSTPVNPNPDPHEKYEYVYQQMYNVPKIPKNIPSPPPVPAKMQGFINDYANALQKENPDGNPTNIMNCFTPAELPVISTLAEWYAVCDNWFASVPTQTFANRSFVHAGTSSGYVNNQWWSFEFPFLHFLMNGTDTIYNLMEDAGLPWRIYYGGPLFLCNALLTQTRLRQFACGDKRRFYPFAQFLEDIQSEATFSKYSFIEPNFVGCVLTGPENDEHPQASPFEDDGPSNVLFGEQLLFDIFTNLTKSPAWPNTLLIIVFDEHGGTFDHVVPPTNVPSPDGKVIPPNQSGGSGFTFDRLGVRVPAVIVSPLIGKGTINNVQFDHTSVIKTVINAFGLNTTLLAREEAANDLGSLITLATPRTDLPSITPIQPPSTDSLGLDAETPLTDFQIEMLTLGVAVAAEMVPHAIAERATAAAASVGTHAQAAPLIGHLLDLEKKLFAE